MLTYNGITYDLSTLEIMDRVDDYCNIAYCVGVDEYGNEHYVNGYYCLNEFEPTDTELC